jgi:NhaP-type Na+/H+ and K+/H+ antiporter
MFKMRSVTGRVAIGKAIGFVVGLIVMLALPSFDMEILSMFGLGTLLMFVLMGVMTGFMGVFDRHPMFDFSMPWYFRGPMVGVSFMLMYVLFTYDSLDLVMQSSLVSWSGLESPFWALLDGLFIGGLMGGIETKFAGEGKDLPVK